MLQFITGSNEAFADLERRARTACIVFADQQLPPGSSPSRTRVGFEVNPEDESAVLFVDRGIKYAGENDAVRDWLSNGEKKFESFSELQQWIRKTLATVYGNQSTPLRALTDFDEVRELARAPLARFHVQEEALFDELSMQIRGQEPALRRLARGVVHQFARLKPRRPATFFMLGPTGVGKTKTAESLSSALRKLSCAETSFGYLRLDMSEYHESHRASQLLGAPQGYIGYGDGSQLIETLSSNPRSVILFDEIEKAHPNILRTLMNAIDAGRLSSASRIAGDRVVDCRSAVLLFTSNIDATDIVSELNPETALSDSVLDAVCRKRLRTSGVAPEIVSRIGCFLLFRPLANETRMEIVALAVVRIADEYGVKVRHIAPETIAALLSEESDHDFGTRPYEYMIDELLGASFVDAAQKWPGAEIEVRGTNPFSCLPLIESSPGL